MPPVIALVVAVGTYISTAYAAAAAAYATFSALTQFLIATIGSIVLGVGAQLVSSLFIKKPAQTPSIEAGKINVRISEPERWNAYGRSRLGGGIIFAEFDSQGNLWYVMVHCDSILKNIVAYFFDDYQVNVAANNEVIDNQFSLDGYGNVYSGTGVRINAYKIWTRTFTETNPVPGRVAEFDAAFPTLWTSDHKLVGTTYSVVRIKAMPSATRHNVYRWRGPIGMGEPSVSIVGDWHGCYDPREPSHVLGNRTTYHFSRNPALIWAAFRTAKYGRDKAESTINWERVAEQANICDQLVQDIDGNDVVRYQCGLAIPESKERNQAEQEILISCDGQIVFDDDGKCWPRVGYYYAPSLKLVRNRDIVGLDSVEAQNGESATQGVIVRYIDPDAGYSSQPCAAWINPHWYVPGQTVKYLNVDALAVQNHNQAMRLAKSIGVRSQSLHKVLPTVGLRGLKARQERIISLNYDNTFSGDYEIVTPLEVDKNGVFCGFGAVPVNPDRWTLLSGEEKKKPEVKTSEDDSIVQLPSNVVKTFENGQIRITFTPAPRPDVRYIFQHQVNSGTPAVESDWFDFSTNMEQSVSISGTVAQNASYFVRYRTLTNGGKSTAWFDDGTIGTTLIVLTGTPVLTGKVATAYAGFTVAATGGTSPYAFIDVYGRLPPGLTIDLNSGIVSGTPTTAGTYPNIVIRVYDLNDNFANLAMFSITIAP